jgi:uncharacterized membrane protein
MDDSTRSRGTVLGKALGWASLALGTPLLAAPGRTARALGLDDTPGTRAAARGVGLREYAAGAAILTERRPAPGLWARVGGDAMDLALLGNGLRARSQKRRVAAALAAVAGITVVDLLAAARNSGRVTPSRIAAGGTIILSAGVTVNRSASDAYALWRDFSRLPEFMIHLRSVSEDGRHWVAEAPGGATVEWDAEVTEDEPDRLLAWRSVEGADVPNAGVVRFGPAPGGRGTEVRVELTYQPPAGRLGDTVARLLGEQPRQQVTDDLRRFKQILETGEVVRSEASPEGVHSLRLVRQRPGQPEGGES